MNSSENFINRGFSMPSAMPSGAERQAGLHGRSGECLVSNYSPCSEPGDSLTLQPYESFALAPGARAA